MKVEIHLFGEFEVNLKGNPQVLKGAKPQALLAYLAAGIDRTHPRDRLTGLLWADHPEANARTNLRQALSGIRRALPDGVVQTDGDGIRLSSADVWVDVDQFERQRQAAEVDQRLAAAALYDGDLLDGFRGKSAGFDDWLMLERERLRRHACDLLSALLHDVALQRQPERAIEAGSRLIRLDPTDERAHRTLMQLYVDTGKSGLALRQFRVCEDVLKRELGTVPSMDTVALMRQIKTGGLQGGAHTAASDARGDTQTEGTEGVEAADLDAGSTEEASTASAHSVAAGTQDRQPRLPAITVLPFTSMSSDPEHGYLADGMTDELINMLANCVNWRVTARNTSFKFKDQQVDVRDLGRDLGADYVVEGSIRRVGQRIRATAQLINTVDGLHIWSDRYDRPLEDIFDVQDEVVHAIFRVLKNRIGFAERERVRRTPSANLDAWGLLVKAGQIRVRDAKTRDMQRALISEALTIDPDYPRAHAFMASVVYTSVGRGSTSDAGADMALARSHCDAALASGHTDVLVLKLCAGGLAAIGDASRALELAERVYALQRSPDSLLVAVLMWHGRFEEAQAHCEEIVDELPQGLPTSPGELRPVALLGNLHMLQGKYDEALRYAKQDASANPDNFFSYVNLANVHGLMGNADAAHASWAKAKELVPLLTRELFVLGYQKVMTSARDAERFGAGLEAVGID